MNLDIIGAWKGRIDDTASAAERLQRSLALMPQHPHDTYTQWGTKHWDEQGIFSIEAILDDLVEIEGTIRRTTENVNDGPRSEPGLHLKLVRSHPDRQYEVDDRTYDYHVRCGFERPRNHILLQLDPDIGGYCDPITVVRAYMAALVNAWEPDHLAALPLPFLKAQGHRTPQVRVGWMTYIRDGIELDTSILEKTLRRSKGDGGTYIRLAGTPEDPDLDQAMLVRKALGY